jgi:hypothetical protein
MRRGFEHVLDECLSQLNTGELGLEEVLARYPEHEAELRPLLRVAMLVRQTPRAVPSREAKAAGRQQLLAAVVRKKQERAQAQAQARVRLGLLPRLRQNVATLVQPWTLPYQMRQPLRLAQAIAAVLLIFSLVSAGTVGVAADSLPDSPLYTIKRATERVQLALTSEPESKARLHMSYSEKRLDEARILWEAGKGLSEATLQAMGSENSGAWTAINQVSEAERLSLLGDFTLLTERQQAILEEMKAEVAPAEQEAVEEALEAAEEYQSVATEAMAEPDLLLTPSPTPWPSDTPMHTATAAPPTATHTSEPVPPTHTPKPVSPATPTSVPATHTPVPTATPVPPTATHTPKPAPKATPTPVPPTHTPIPPTPTPVPTATPTPQAVVTFEPTEVPTATPTPQSELPPFKPTVDPATESTPTVEPTPASTPQSGLPPFQPTAEP